MNEKMRRLFMIPVMAVCLFGMTSCGTKENATVAKKITYLKTQTHHSLSKLLCRSEEKSL